MKLWLSSMLMVILYAMLGMWACVFIISGNVGYIALAFVSGIAGEYLCQHIYQPKK